MPIYLQYIPNLVARTTLEDTEERRNQVENKDTKDTDSDCNHQWQISFDCGREDPGVLKKKRDFDEENRRTIEYNTDIDQLVSCLAGNS